MDGTPGGTRELVDSGIQTENSDIRAHVCPVVRLVYVYPTECGITAINSGKFRKYPGFQEGVEEPTSEGYLVPPFAIERQAAVSVNDNVWEALAFSKSDSPTEKKEKSERLVRGMLKQGIFPLPAKAKTVHDKNEQIAGTDFIVEDISLPEGKTALRIQVKCDFDGGDKDRGGTGNLFIQVAECNPLGYH